MDLQGVGAITAAAVAAVSIPITALVGRWQMRGAMQTAEATYKAAVDAAKNQATSTQEQWRRGVQRDAYAALLVAANRIRTVVIHRIAGDGGDDFTLSSEARAELYAARTTLQSTYAVTTLEGSDAVRTAATQLRDAAFEFAAEAEAIDARQRTIKYLNRKVEEETRLAQSGGSTGPSPGPWLSARSAFLAMSGLYAATEDRCVSIPEDFLMVTQGFDEAFIALPFDQVPPGFVETLRFIANAPLERAGSELSISLLRSATDKFVDAARAELAGPFPS